MNILQLVIKSSLLGIGLAMDAFSVSIANGLAEPSMKRSRMAGIAGVYAFFQFMMPLIGWFCVHKIAEAFSAFQPFIPWIALILLSFIGGKMVYEGISKKTPGDKEATAESSSGASSDSSSDSSSKSTKLTLSALLIQGVATSIDALSVGFTIADYSTAQALGSAAIIGVLTMVICVAGLIGGKKLGEKFSDKATVIGGIILIGIGLEIFIKSFF